VLSSCGVLLSSLQGLKLPTGVLEHLSAGHLEETVSRLQRIGINAAEMPQKLMAYPGLFKQLQEPKYMQVGVGERVVGWGEAKASESPT
jgi:hypothetical protein